MVSKVREIDEGFSFDLGNFHLDVIHLPGESKFVIAGLCFFDSSPQRTKVPNPRGSRRGV